MYRRSSIQSIQSYWGGAGWVKDRPFLQLVFGQTGLRSFQNTHFPDVSTGAELQGDAGIRLPQELTRPGAYLLSGLLYDLRTLKKVDWTADFDAFWGDRVASHERLFDALYTEKGSRFHRLLIGDCRGPEHAEEMRACRKALNELTSMYKWACETEKVYSAIFYARFDMQRNVWTALEREQKLLGCAEVYSKFAERVPAAYYKKATKDLYWHLTTMRHWVWDCPNAKHVYSRLLA